MPSGPHAKRKAGSARNVQKATIEPTQARLGTYGDAHVSAQIEDIKHHNEKGNSKWQGIMEGNSLDKREVPLVQQPAALGTH